MNDEELEKLFKKKQQSDNQLKPLEVNYTRIRVAGVDREGIRLARIQAERSSDNQKRDQDE